MRNNYWSCSKLANWLRGTPKPGAATSKGWNQWTQEAKSNHPIRYWIAEEGLDIAQKIVYWPTDQLYSIKYYINNRWITRTHSLTAHPRDIKPGQWCDVGNRFLPCLFNELVDFIEVEQAWNHIAWSDEARKKYKAPWWSYGWFRVRTWRSPAAGMDHLVWASGLRNTDWASPGDPEYNKPTPQAERAKEMIDLYVWWTAIRPQRKDPHDASGWSEICDRRRTADGGLFGSMEDETAEELAQTRASLDICHQIEQEYEQEDEDMMIRLIKVRNGLWT